MSGFLYENHFFHNKLIMTGHIQKSPVILEKKENFLLIRLQKQSFLLLTKREMLMRVLVLLFDDIFLLYKKMFVIVILYIKNYKKSPFIINLKVKLQIL